MIGRRSTTQLGTGRNWGIWPVLALIMAAVLVPTACVLWFMTAAMRNERLAVRQRLTDIYRRELLNAQKKLDDHWSAKMRLLQDANAPRPAEAFHKLVTERAFDSVVIYDADGKLAYPLVACPQPETAPAGNAEFVAAREDARAMERAGDPNAAEAFAKLARAEKQTDLRARALQAQARCLLRRGMGVSPMSTTGVSPVERGKTIDEHGRDGRATHGQDARATAVAILGGELAKDEYRAARDALGRLIAPDALLAALRLTPPADANSWKAIAQDLLARLNDYAGPAMPSSQRVFLMTEIEDDIRIYWPTLEAEQLAAEYAEDHPTAQAEAGLARAACRDYWALRPPDGHVVGLVTDHEVAAAVESLGPDAQALVGARAFAHYGPDSGISRDPFLDVPASQYMPGWRLSLYLDGPDPFAAAAEQRNAAYLWTGILGIAFIALLAAGLATYLGRQMRLTRLKNDLIATVSHELKTPLASMRVLVDTLREGRCADEKQAGEYFELIARENERLSRLIDNFLTFSRMERNKRAFEFADVDVADAVGAAVAAVSDRFSPPESRLDVDLPADLPRIRADRDAMVTVLLNLLDNAWKYSGDDKAVTVRAFADDSSVFVEVSDNGVGMSRRAVSRIFDKFYQVDQTLSRKAGGCGLGLAIVKFILDAHGGSISVKSQPGKGSTFTVRLPAEGERAE